MTEVPGTESTAPSVGNVLGFALEFADRRAQLKLDRRVLGPGIVLSDFAAEIPGVRFPVQHPVSVGTFRHRRCRTLTATLRLDARHLAQRLRAALVGVRLDAFEIDAIDLSFGERARHDDVEVWCHLTGRHVDGGRIEVCVGVSAATGQRTIRIVPVYTWVFGEGPVSAAQVWSEIARALQPTGNDELELDPLGPTLVRGFSRAGWKAPDLARLVVEEIEVEDGAIILRYCQRQLAGHARPAPPRPTSDPVADAIETARGHLAAHRWEEATSALEALVRRVRHLRPARLAATRWLVRALRHGDTPRAADACLSALAGWLRLRPDDPLARRWFVEALARGHRFDELVRFTEACRATQSDDPRRARLDLAAALLMTDHLGDRGRARALLAPWSSAIDRSPELDALRVPIRTALAKARADTPRAAVRTLADVVDQIDDPTRRASARLTVARSLLDADAPDEALELIREAARDDPSHPDLGPLAERLATAVDPGDAAEPARADIPLVPDMEAAARRAIAAGDLARAAELLLRMRTAAGTPADEARLRLARTDVLVRAEKFGQVWSELAPALDMDELPARDQALRWGIEFAPSRTAQALVETLSTLVSPEAAIEALETRWNRWKTLDSSARALVDRLESREDHDRARRLCLEFAQQLGGQAAVTWLVRAASHATAKDAAALLARALEQSGADAELERQLEGALREAGSLDALHALWQRQARDSEVPTERRLRALDRLIAYRLGDAEPTSAGRTDVELVELCRQRFTLGPTHRVANLILADEARRAGDSHALGEHLGRALELMGPEDPRRARPALELATLRLEGDELDDARELAESVVRIDPTPEAWALLARVARRLGDDTVLCRALRGAVLRPADRVQEAEDRAELGRALSRLGRLDEACEQFEMAAAAVDPQSPIHLQIAESWVETVRDGRADPTAEARARRELRLALGPDLPASELEAEARLVAEALDDPSAALDLVEEGLRHRPTDPLLLSTHKNLCVRASELARYVQVLEHGAEKLPPGSARDALLLELAAAAVDDDRAQAALDALDRLSAGASAATQALDLRAWVVGALGRQDEELAAIDDRLRVAPGDPSALARLGRALPDPARRADHLLRVASDLGATDATALVRAAAEALRGQREPATVLRAMRRTVELGLALQDAIPDTIEVWRNAVASAIVDGDEVTVAELVQWATRPETPQDLTEPGERGLDDALAALVEAPRLMALLWSRLSSSQPDPTRAAIERIERIAREAELDPPTRARLLVGLADVMPAESARALLETEAADALGDPARVELFIDALARHGHIPELLRLLERRLADSHDGPERIALLKRLAHLYGDAAADPQRRAEALTRALELAPDDPDLLLPLLDHSFDTRDLPRAIELATRVLDRITMGTIAFVALAHRAADAALALGDPDVSAQLLRRAADRDPADERTLRRLEQVEQMRGDPRQRVVLLGIVADRQSGSARLEALEEKARLLADPLGQTDEAIATLEHLLAESPGHGPAVELLRRLYPGAGRWRSLADLLESQVSRTHGVARCELLRELASIHREHLLDAPRAEHTLRIALDHLGSASHNADLAEAIRADLVANLESQGRYVDLSIYLERALAPELEGRMEPEQLHPIRGDLLVHLARIFRGPLDNEEKAGRVYERLEQLGRLPDEGLATLARIFHRGGRHADLVRILRVRSRALAEQNEWARKASVDHRIGELLEGPLGRPHEATPHYLDAYIANPVANADAGKRARILLAGVDAVVNVRAELLRRLDTLQGEARPALLTLLADVLAPHDEYEAEAEAAYEEALSLAPGHGPAQEALGRLLARQGRLEDAVGPLSAAARNATLDSGRAAENAAIGARALAELERIDDAEALLKEALQRAPDSQRALLELARLYERTGRATEQAIVLESLSELPISSMLAAEVSYQRAALLMPAARRDAFSSEAERARVYLLESVSSDAKHVAARTALVELSRARLEWSVVAHMHYLAIRDLPPGPSRAKTHLDLAETYLDHLEDPQSAARNIESALQQAPEELAIVTRAGRLAARLPDARRVAERFESIAATAPELEDGVRARLWLLAADLRMSEDDVAAAEAASQRVLDLQRAPSGAVAAAQRNLDTLAEDDARDLRQQKSGLLRLLESETNPGERAHLLTRLRDVGLGLGDLGLVEKASREQLELSELNDEQFEAAMFALRDTLAERGAHAELVDLFGELADQADPDRASMLLQEAAAFAWTGLGEAERAATLLERAMTIDPQRSGVYRRLGEIAEASAAKEVRERLLGALERIPAGRRTPVTDLHTAILALQCGRTKEGIAMLRPLTVQRGDLPVRLRALRELDAILDATATDTDRLPILRRRFDETLSQGDGGVTAIATDLVRIEIEAGHLDRALATCDLAIEHEGSTADLLRLRVRVLERLQRWPDAAVARETLAQQQPDMGLRARELEAAARIWLDHESSHPNARRQGHALGQARRLLLAACDSAPDLASPRGLLLPVEFAARNWGSALRLGVELRELGGDDDARLILAALTQAFRHGQRSLAKALGPRYSASDHDRYLFPGLRQLLTEVATVGPLPRLDSVLAAAAALCGGRRELDHAMRSWAAGKPLQAGVALGLARLSEADGRADLARSLYQLAAFMLPDGPVPAVVGRLPLARPPAELTADDRGPLGRGSTLRLALLRARDTLSGLDEPRPALAEPKSTRFALADTIVEPLRRRLGLPLPLRYETSPDRPAVSVVNSEPPAITIGAKIEDLSVAELRFRLAMNATIIAMGLAIVASGRLRLVEVLDGLARMASPGHEPTGEGARSVADRISRDGLHRRLTPSERQALASELSHWLSRSDEPAPLKAELERFELWFATRLSGQLDGALCYLARELGTVLNTGTPDPVATLRSEEAQWLLRGLELYSSS